MRFVAGKARGRFRRRLRSSKPVSATYIPRLTSSRLKRVHRNRELWLDEMEHSYWILDARHEPERP